MDAICKRSEEYASTAQEEKNVPINYHKVFTIRLDVDKASAGDEFNEN